MSAEIVIDGDELPKAVVRFEASDTPGGGRISVRTLPAPGKIRIRIPDPPPPGAKR